jgi:hypothetical protein
MQTIPVEQLQMGKSYAVTAKAIEGSDPFLMKCGKMMYRNAVFEGFEGGDLRFTTRDGKLLYVYPQDSTFTQAGGRKQKKTMKKRKGRKQTRRM